MRVLYVSIYDGIYDGPIYDGTVGLTRMFG